MGLDVSHGAFSAPYSTFNTLRQIVCEAAGGSYPPHKDSRIKAEDRNYWFIYDDAFSEKSNPGLFIFFKHSDCDGDISPADCLLVAEELTLLLPKINEICERSSVSPRFVELTKTFIAGCREANNLNEPLEFY